MTEPGHGTDSDLRELERAAAQGDIQAGINLAMKGCRLGKHAWSDPCSVPPSGNIGKWKAHLSKVLGEDASVTLVAERSCFWCGAIERWAAVWLGDPSTLHRLYSDGRLEPGRGEQA